MKDSHLLSTIGLVVIATIGCGGSHPQEASAERAGEPDAPMQLAQAPSEPAQGSAAGSASVKGTIRFEGAAPASEKIKMDADPVCQQQHATPVTAEDVVVNSNGTLKNVIVYVKEGVKGSAPAPTTPVVLNQKGCWYQPHVFGIQTNQPLEIVNSDATLHNINAKPTQNQPFNIAQPVQGMKTQKKFTKPEVGVTFKCNVHPWMRAYAVVTDHPFFSVSDGVGAFTISGLPAGTYVLEAWHEKYGTSLQNVTVSDGQTQSADFTFNAK